MVNMISFPFRVGPGGVVVTREQNSTDYYGELVSVLVLTKPGERELVPSFGVNDPTFDKVDDRDLESKLSIFGPPVRIVSVTTTDVGAIAQDVEVKFEPIG